MNKSINNIMAIVIGLLLSVFGLQLCFNPILVRRVTGYAINLEGYNLPIGLLIAGIGIALLITGISPMRNKHK